MSTIRFTANELQTTQPKKGVTSILLLNPNEERALSLQFVKSSGQHYVERDDQSMGCYNGVKGLVLHGSKLEVSLNSQGAKALQCTKISVDFDIPQQDIKQLEKSLSSMFPDLLKLHKSFSVGTSSPKAQPKNPAKDYSKVRYLDLSHKNLKKLPEYVAEMELLETIKLQGNPALNMQETVKVLATLPNLRKAQLGSNGPIPEEIGLLTTLEELLIGDLSGREVVPTSIGRLQNLKLLQIVSSNELVLPEEIADLTGLETFTISAKKWNAPVGISKLTNLKALSLSECTLSSLPPDMPNMTKLESLYFCKNVELNWADAFRIMGEMPSLRNLQLLIQPDLKGIGNCRQLKKLRISMTGSPEHPLTLPDEIWNLTNLESLDLSGNFLAEVSDQIQNLKELKTLSFYESNLTQLPETIGNLSKLTVLNVSENPELASLPATLSQISGLKIYKS